MSGRKRRQVGLLASTVFRKLSSDLDSGGILPFGWSEEQSHFPVRVEERTGPIVFSIGFEIPASWQYLSYTGH